MAKKMLKADLEKEVARKEEVIVGLHEERNKLQELLDTATAALEDAKLVQNDNVYDAGEQKFIKFYQYGFYVLLTINILQLLF